MKNLMKIFVMMVLMALFLGGCGSFVEMTGFAGKMTVDEKNRVSGSTYSQEKMESMIRTNSQAVLWEAYAKNPAAFGYKCPFDPTDQRATRNTNYNRTSSSGSDVISRANEIEQKILQAGR